MRTAFNSSIVYIRAICNVPSGRRSWRLSSVWRRLEWSRSPPPSFRWVCRTSSSSRPGADKQTNKSEQIRQIKDKSLVYMHRSDRSCTDDLEIVYERMMYISWSRYFRAHLYGLRDMIRGTCFPRNISSQRQMKLQQMKITDRRSIKSIDRHTPASEWTKVTTYPAWIEHFNTFPQQQLQRTVVYIHVCCYTQLLL